MFLSLCDPSILILIYYIHLHVKMGFFRKKKPVTVYQWKIPEREGVEGRLKVHVIPGCMPKFEEKTRIGERGGSMQKNGKFQGGDKIDKKSRLISLTWGVQIISLGLIIGIIKFTTKPAPIHSICRDSGLTKVIEFLPNSRRLRFFNFSTTFKLAEHIQYFVSFAL